MRGGTVSWARFSSGHTDAGHPTLEKGFTMKTYLALALLLSLGACDKKESAMPAADSTAMRVPDQGPPVPAADSTMPRDTMQH